MVTINKEIHGFFFFEESYDTGTGNDYPWGICKDDTYFYICNISDGKVYKYNTSFTLQTSYSLDAGNSLPNDICWDGTHFYICDNELGDRRIFKYNSAFVLQASYAMGHNVSGITWDGTNFYVVDGDANQAKKYNTAFVLQASYDLDNVTNPYGIHYYNDRFYVADDSEDKIFKYYNDFEYIKTFSMTSGHDRVVSIFFDGDYYYIPDYQDSKIYKYADIQLIDITSDITFCEIVNEVEKFPKAKLNAIGQTFEDDNIIQIKDKYTSHHVSGDVQYQGEHNFEGITTTGKYYRGSAALREEDVGDNEAGAGDSTGAKIAWMDYISANGTTEIVAEYEDHRNCIRYEQTEAANHYFYHNIEESKTGIFDCWFALPDNTDTFTIMIRDGSDNCIRYQFKNTDFKVEYDDGGVWFRDLGDFASATWYHVSVEWYDDDTFDLYLDGDKVVDGETMAIAMGDGITRIVMYALLQDAVAYIDAPALDMETCPSGYLYRETMNINPYDWKELIDAGYAIRCAFDCTIRIRKAFDPLDGHKDVLVMYDNADASLDYGLYLYFNDLFDDGEQTYGTIELFMRTTDATKSFRFEIKDGGTPAQKFIIDLDKFRYDDGAVKDIGLAALDNTWYHIRIAFRCAGADAYEDLAEDTWKVWINGVEYGDYDFIATHARIDRCIFWTDQADNGYYCYVDALDYSWATGYFTNRNRIKTDGDETIFEGMITKYTKEYKSKLNLESQTIEFRNYKEGDEASPTTITVDYSDHMLEDIISNYYNEISVGLHDEQYRDSWGFNYNDIDDEDMAIFGIHLLNKYNGEIIIKDWQSHDNVIRLKDDATGGEDPYFVHNFTQEKEGTYEFYIGTNDVTENWQVQLLEDSTIICGIKITGSAFQVYKSGGWAALDTPTSVSNNTWYHVKIIITDDTTDTFKTYINSVEKSNDDCNANQTSGINKISFRACGDSTDYLYIDGIGHVSEVNPKSFETYVEGNNLHLRIDEFDVGTKLNADIVLRGDKSGENIAKSLSDFDFFIWYILSNDDKLAFNNGQHDNYFIPTTSDPIWSIKGLYIPLRINMVVTIGGFGGGNRQYGSWNDSDSQTTYGYKVLLRFATHLTNSTDLDNLAEQIGIRESRSPTKIQFVYKQSTYGLFQVGERVYIPADTLKFDKSRTYVDAGYYIILRNTYNPITKVSKMILANSIIIELEESEMEELEALINQ